jgi:spermidine synthase
VIWTRVLSLMFGATVYTFSIILAVFLTGLGIGSAAGAFLAARVARPRVALGLCQLLLAVAIAWTAFAVARVLPAWRIIPRPGQGVWIGFGRDLLRCLCAVGPPTCLWGASFPLALAAVASRDEDPGRLPRGVYAANTVGAIVGAVAFGILLIPLAGTQNAQRLLVALSAVAAILALVPRMSIGSILAIVAVAAPLAWKVPRVPDLLVAYGRNMLTEPRSFDRLKFQFVGEGTNASVAVTELFGVRSFHVSGKVEASSEPADMRLQRMLGHLPALLHPRPRSVLVVGCGAGVTAGSFVVHPEVERIVICEIEPLIPKVVARHFGGENHDVL